MGLLSSRVNVLYTLGLMISGGLCFGFGFWGKDTSWNFGEASSTPRATVYTVYPRNFADMGSQAVQDLLLPPVGTLIVV